MDLCLEHETLGVYQQVTLTALNLLASVVTTLFSAHSGRFDRLGIHYACAGLRISLQANPQAVSETSIDTLPGAVYAPSSEVVIDRGPSREVVRKHAPWPAIFRIMEIALEVSTKPMNPRCP